jgi:hypothetical protein
MAAIVQKTKTKIFLGEAQLGNCGKSSAEKMSIGKKISVEKNFWNHLVGKKMMKFGEGALFQPS